MAKPTNVLCALCRRLAVIIWEDGKQYLVCRGCGSRKKVSK